MDFVRVLRILLPSKVQNWILVYEGGISLSVFVM
jgi:hypothetical protein